MKLKLGIHVSKFHQFSRNFNPCVDLSVQQKLAIRIGLSRMSLLEIQHLIRAAANTAALTRVFWQGGVFPLSEYNSTAGGGFLHPHHLHRFRDLWGFFKLLVGQKQKEKRLPRIRTGFINTVSDGQFFFCSSCIYTSTLSSHLTIQNPYQV